MPVVRLPSLQGVIRRRLLVNFRVDPDVMKRQLPADFEPKLQGGFAVAGICLIRLEQIRPALVGLPAGVSSENAAHRVAVVRRDGGSAAEGVFIPRRHSDSWLVLAAGGRLFPGQHKRARFDIHDDGSTIEFSMRSTDGLTDVRLRGKSAVGLPVGSIFPSVQAASNFFKGGSVGYSATSEPRRLEAIRLETREWKVAPLEVSEVHSSWFADLKRFPKGSVEFDCALVMRNVAHRWFGQPDLYVEDAHTEMVSDPART
jgi:hypothetical protein